MTANFKATSMLRRTRWVAGEQFSLTPLLHSKKHWSWDRRLNITDIERIQYFMFSTCHITCLDCVQTSIFSYSSPCTHVQLFNLNCFLSVDNVVYPITCWGIHILCCLGAGFLLLSCLLNWNFVIFFWLLLHISCHTLLIIMVQES